MLKKVLHIAMSFVLLISITGFTLHKHYCNGELTEVSVMVDSHHCGMTSCSHCEDVISGCRLEVDLISPEIQSSPENTQLELSYSNFVSIELMTQIEVVRTTIFPKKAQLNPSLHGISMLQCFLCWSQPFLKTNSTSNMQFQINIVVIETAKERYGLIYSNEFDIYNSSSG